MDSVGTTDNRPPRQIKYIPPASNLLVGASTHLSPTISNVRGSSRFSSNGILVNQKVETPFPSYRSESIATARNKASLRRPYVRIPVDNRHIPPEITQLRESTLVHRAIESIPPLSNGFWLEHPSSLFQSFELFPQPEMNDAERLNAMTRMIILIAAIMFVAKFPGWLTFLVIGMIIVIILWYIVKGRPYQHQREYIRPPRRSIIQPLAQNPTSYTVNNQPLHLISIK